MTQLRTVLILLAVAIIGVAVFLTRGSAPRSLGEGVSEAAVPREAGARGDASPSAIRAEPFSPPEPDSEVAAPGLLFEVRVIHAATGEGAPGMQVSACDATRYFSLLSERGIVNGSPASRAIKAGLASEATTDAGGSATLPWPGERVLVEARDSRHWGFAFLPRRPDAVVEIRVKPEETLRVRVLSAEGEPRAGVPLTLRRAVPGDERFMQVFSETEGLQGIALFEHLQRRFSFGDGWHVAPAFPVLGEVQLPVTEGAVPLETVDLVLPATGSLAIRVRDRSGRPVGGSGLELSVVARWATGSGEPIPTDGRWSSPVLGDRGRATVPWLGTGLSLEVTAAPRDRESDRVPVVATILGPRHDGEVVELQIEVQDELPPEARFPMLAGRLIRGDGTPWGAVRVVARLHLVPISSSPAASQMIDADEAGRFRVFVTRPPPPTGVRRFLLRAPGAEAEGEVQGWLEIPAGLVPGTLTDVGDVILDRGALLASGRVIDDAGQPIAGATCYVSAPTERSGVTYWPRIDVSGSDLTGEDGSFRLFATPGAALPSGTVQVSAWHASHLDVDLAEVPVGAHGVELVLSRAGGLAGSIALAEDQGAEDFVLRIEGQGRRRTIHLRPDGTFEVARLAPGPHALEVRLVGATESDERGPGLRIEGLEVVSGLVNRDPRLAGIRVAGRVPKLELVVRDTWGRPVRGARVVGADRTGVVSATSDGQGRATLRGVELPMDVEVSAFGVRRVRLPDLEENRQVVLAAGIPVRITTGARAIPGMPPYMLRLQLLRIEGEQGAREDPFLHGAPTGALACGSDGVLELSLPLPGTYEIRPMVIVLGPVASRASLELDPLPRIAVDDVETLQTFAIEVPMSLVEATIRRLSH